MIEMRMVAVDRGDLQLQVRKRVIGVDTANGGALYDGKSWEEWKSVPIVHDPSQLLDRVEIFDARASGAKPDGGLTGAQVSKILKEFETVLDRHQIEANDLLGSVDVKSTIFHHGVVAGIQDCLLVIRAELSPQPAEPEIDL
jgi:hypothetical protein